jgi:acetylornithine deacetylase/succinyl-diaminopimelate desuccinylase-like protein
MLGDLKRLTDLQERRSPAGQKAAADYLRSQLGAQLGLEVKEYPYTYNGGSYVNLEVTIPGVETPGRHILAGAHFDSTSNDPALAPGADDNASGTVALLEAARVLSGCRPQQSIGLLFFSNEEAGAVGSREYVKSIKGVLPPENVVGFINVDMVGYGPEGEDLDIATKPAFRSFADGVAGAVQKHTALKAKETVGDQCG